jgi:hypothetical protein
VPDGTTAKVRCPACKNIFAPAESLAPEPDEDQEEQEEEEEEAPKAKKRNVDRDEDKPRKKTRAAREEDEDEDAEDAKKNRDFDPVTEEEDQKRKRKRRRRGDFDESLTPEEKAARRAAFQRAAIGVKLIWSSFGLFIFSMMLILIYYFQSALIDPVPYFLTIAGVLGLLNWILAAVGVGLCLSGPVAPGHWGYGISAAVAVVIHLVFLLALMGQGAEVTVYKADERGENAGWWYLPTRLNITMFYLTAVAYPDNQGLAPKGRIVLSMVTGVAEMVRTVLIMMFLSCLARAALDEDLAHKCTRAAGVASFGPGIIALAHVTFVAIMIETNAVTGTGAQVFSATVQMGIYAIIVGTIFPAFMTAREVADACDEPFQSLIPQL